MKNTTLDKAFAITGAANAEDFLTTLRDWSDFIDLMVQWAAPADSLEEVADRAKSAERFRHDYPDPETWSPVICADCHEWNEFCQCPEGSQEPPYRCDRCGRFVSDEGSWSDMASFGAWATEDGGVLCPKCFGEEPLVNPETGYIMARAELNEDDAAQFSGDYVVFDPQRGAFSFDRLEEAEAFLHGDDEVPVPGPVEPEGHVCEVCELDLVRRGDIVGMPHRQLHVTEGGTELCPECYGLYLQGDGA